MEKFECTECGTEFPIPKDCAEKEIIDCPCCGTGYEVMIVDGKPSLTVLWLDGDDWGE